jgi:predicted choloylglycine hydrolase
MQEKLEKYVYVFIFSTIWKKDGFIHYYMYTNKQVLYMIWIRSDDIKVLKYDCAWVINDNLMIDKITIYRAKSK